MFLSDLELFLIELPASDGAVRTLLVRLVTQSGTEGWGETRSSWHPAELAARAKSLAAVLIGHEACDVEVILTLDVLEDRALACGVEMALWDLIARQARVPLCQLLGGAYRGSVPMSVPLPQDEPEATVHWARAIAAQGIGSITVTCSGAIEDDLTLADLVRESCADHVRVRLDAARRFDLAGASRLCATLAPHSVECVLDPLVLGQEELLSVVRATARVPLGVSRWVESPADMLRWAAGDAVTYALIDPLRVGGLSRARQCAAVAEAGGVAAGLANLGTSGLALAATLQLAAATPGFSTTLECSYLKLHDDILIEPVRIADGMLTVPMAPGLGVEIDRDKVERYQLEI